MVEQVVLDDQVAVVIEQRRAVRGLPVDLVAGGVLGWFAHGGEEDRVIVLPWAERPGLGIVVPFLHKQHAGLGAGVRLEDVAVQADDGEDARFLDVAGERRIGHQHVEGEIAVAGLAGAQLAQALPAFAVDVGPFLVAGFFVPALVIQRIEVQHVGLALQ